ncbi:YqeG family HAD IIIA-type phosphatase [Candidatus Saganbacteria bacterium]|nr:YqeG family HAD IIIA-type phosphatase [Candidatus Saganbacteria bacterium]
MNVWFNPLQPKQNVLNIKEINFSQLKRRGISALILDIDDTLVPRLVKDITPDIFEWVATRKEEGFKICLTSNSRHPLRVKYIGDTLGVPAMPLSFKPFPFAFWRALQILGVKPDQAVMIGDQLFMDILGANLVGIHTIFVKHLTPETNWARKLMRWLEVKFLRGL